MREFATDLPLEQIQKVSFYKRDELTSDLICCQVEMADTTWTFHEEHADWLALLAYLGQLPDFTSDWFGQVSHPAFEECATVVFSRP